MRAGYLFSKYGIPPLGLPSVWYRAKRKVLRCYRMRRRVHVPKKELLQAMKDALRDLENTKMLNPGDLDIIEQKRDLRKKIAELERDEDQCA